MIRALGWQITRTSNPEAKWTATNHEGTQIHGRTFEELLGIIRARRVSAWL